ncbi:hypothetical protein KFK14_17580 [Sphingobium phenoxybenzoativorans]|uniref:DNA 5'-3' helicase DnaB n=1 Tax=Sphingobium phenoxybenzoativorans TaxID=1592790 RepID=A0A975Q0X6_9SPHN|nr:DnaB-like helicase N-terminal domain-containing protein [Sphingobium phenoxybenzoativorans]QUT04828.1 hypothetical protein KFK14_17580 [Sphingobium phenoxybenzoativorans]
MTLDDISLPSTTEAEGGIIAALLAHNKFYDGVAARLRAEHFSEAIFGRVYSEIGNILATGVEANAISVSRALSSEPAFAELGGAKYLLGLSDSLYASAGVGAVDHVIDMARRRALRDQLLHAAASLSDLSKDIGLTAEAVEAGITEVQSRSAVKRNARFGDAYTEALDRIDALARGEIEAGLLVYGWSDFNELTDGIRPGDYVLVGARASMGKAQPDDCKVLTPTGWVQMGSLNIGDELASHDGAASEVTGIFPQGERQVYRITLSDGLSIGAQTGTGIGVQ